MAYDITSLPTMKRYWLLRNSNIPTRFIGEEPQDIIDDTGTFPETIEDWLEGVLSGDIIKNVGGLGITGKGLLFDGEPGLGKTTHAVTALMEFVRRLPNDRDKACEILDISSDDFGMNCRPVYYLTFPEFLTRKKALIDADPETKKKLYSEMEGFHGRSDDDRMNVRVLVLDDLGKEYGTNYVNTSFDEVLRARYDKALPTIITTNVPLQAWADKYGAAMGSFAHEAFSLVRIIGKDLRK